MKISVATMVGATAGPTAELAALTSQSSRRSIKKFHAARKRRASSRSDYQSDYQVFFRHLYSEGNQNVSRFEKWGFPRTQAHLTNTLHQYVSSRVHAGRTAALLEECATGVADFNSDTELPPFLFGAKNVDIAVPPQAFPGLHRMYAAMDQLKHKLGAVEWERLVLRPWCVSRLVRTWETAFMAAQRASELFPVGHHMNWIVCPDLDEALPSDRSRRVSVHRSVVRKLGRVPPENQSTSLIDNVHRLQCFCNRINRSFPCPLLIWYARGPMDNGVFADLSSRSTADTPSVDSLRVDVTASLTFLGTLDADGWTANGGDDSLHVDWTAHVQAACDYPDVWRALSFTHSKCMQHMFGEKVSNGGCIYRTRSRHALLPTGRYENEGA
jgi:hypothetical protein